MPNKPLIGITTARAINWNRPYATVCGYYAQSVKAAGGLPVLIPMSEDISEVSEYVASLDGFVFSGGNESISPLLYGEEPGPHTVQLMIERDNWEFALMKAALALDKPIFGICRGLQVMNAACGGTLYQRLDKELDKCLGHFPPETDMHNLAHHADLTPESMIRHIMGDDKVLVNTFHNQAVKDLAPDFEITARASDGVVEAIELPSARFALGVQWHPEALASRHPEHLALFRALITACR